MERRDTLLSVAARTWHKPRACQPSVPTVVQRLQPQCKRPPLPFPDAGTGNVEALDEVT